MKSVPLPLCKATVLIAVLAAKHCGSGSSRWARRKILRPCPSLRSRPGFQINLGRLIVLYYDVTRLPASSRATAVALETCSSGAPHAGVPYDSRVARRMASVTRHTKAPRVSARNGQRSETSPIAAARKRAARRSAPLHAKAPRLPCRSAETESDPQSNPKLPISY